MNARVAGTTRFIVTVAVASLAYQVVTLADEPASGATTATARAAKPVLELPIEAAFDTIIVPVRINDSKVLRCILDTGMPEGVFIMDPAKLEGANLELTGPVALNGTGPKPAAGKMALSATVRLADLEFTHERVIVLDEPGELARIGFDGAIGWTVFSKYVVRMDFDRGVLALYRPGDFDASAAGVEIPLTFDKTRPYLDAQVSVSAGAAPAAVTLFIDTGASKSLALNTTPDSAIAPPAETIETLLTSGVGGDTTGRVGRAALLRIGSHELHDLIAEFPAKAGNDHNGTIGMETIRRFNAVFDYPGKRLFLSPAAALAEGFAHDMSGLSLWPDEAGRLRVRAVLAGSPAAEAGVQVGDIIRTIDGSPFTAAQLSQVRKLLKGKEKSVHLDIERGSEVIQVQVRLRKLV